MLVTCRNCLTTYVLDDALVGPNGASVQCTGCQHVFTAWPHQPAPPPPALVPGGARGVRVHPALAALRSGSPSSDRIHYEGPAPVLSDAACERAAWFLWVRAFGAGLSPDEREPAWRREWALLGGDALVRCAERCARVFLRNRQAADMARFFDHELCRLELAELTAAHGLRTSSPVQRILLRGACFHVSVDTWWVELEGPAPDGRSHAVIALGVGREGVTEDTAEGCFAMLPDALARSAPELLRARNTRL